MRITTILADDSDIIRRLLEELIQSCDRLELIGMASNGLEALELVSRTYPELVLLDLEMPEANGWEVLNVLRQMPKPPVIVILTRDATDEDNARERLAKHIPDDLVVMQEYNSVLVKKLEERNQDLERTQAELLRAHKKLRFRTEELAKINVELEQRVAERTSSLLAKNQELVEALAVLEMSDTGTGMTPEICRRIFEPFFITKPADRGTGLGLATVLKIAKDHQGFVTVTSAVGQGS